MVGDRIAVEDDLSNATEVESIQRYENVYVDELEPNFGALLHIHRPLPPLLRPKSKVVTLVD